MHSIHRDHGSDASHSFQTVVYYTVRIVNSR